MKAAGYIVCQKIASIAFFATIMPNQYATLKKNHNGHFGCPKITFYRNSQILFSQKCRKSFLIAFLPFQINAQLTLPTESVFGVRMLHVLTDSAMAATVALLVNK